MTGDELIDSCLARMQVLDKRAQAACRDMDSSTFNAPIPPSSWSPAQILDHLVKVNGPYIDALEPAISSAPAGSNEMVQHSRFGKFLIRAANPSSNTPAPKNLHPSPGPYDLSILATHLSQSQRLADLMSRAKGKDINRGQINNPFMKVFKMTLADVFEAAVQHSERHIGQIEASLKG